MSRDYAASLTVLQWCLLCAVPIGLALLWYGRRLDRELNPRAYTPLSTVVMVLTGLGSLIAVMATLFAVIAFIILLTEGLSLWWLLVPAAAAGCGVRYVERRIATNRR